MKTKLINHDKTSLIIFFCGFYTDENCFIDFDNGKNDILFVWDYSNLENSSLEHFDYTPYTKISVIAYSYGVWALNCVYNMNILPQIDSSCALCGTFCPVDDTYGISEKVYNLMLNSFGENSIDKFIKKMVAGSSKEYEIKRAKRSIENLRAEILNIKIVSNHDWFSKNFQFDKVILTKKDRIFPYASQANFWATHNNKLELDCGHFPFLEFKDFDEILEN